MFLDGLVIGRFVTGHGSAILVTSTITWYDLLMSASVIEGLGIGIYHGGGHEASSGS